MDDLKYLKVLGEKYPTIADASYEIIKLKALAQSPCRDEYFFSDLHGQYDSFERILKSGSGNLRNKISDLFKDKLSKDEQDNLAYLIYEPNKVIDNLDDFSSDDFKAKAISLIKLISELTSPYSYEKLCDKLPESLKSLVLYMLRLTESEGNKAYLENILDVIIEENLEKDFTVSICELIQSLNVGSLHIVGDIVDRGPRPDYIIDNLMKVDKLDIQFGNHDISWIGAFLGNEVSICNLVRNAISYNNFQSLEDAYGINLRVLSNFAYRTYKDDPCERFKIRVMEDNTNSRDEADLELAAKMHKAISVMQGKLSDELYMRNPDFNMDKRLCFLRTDFSKGLYTDEYGNQHEMLDKNFPSVDPKNPTKLSPGEEQVLASLKKSFASSPRFKAHMNFLLDKGTIYKVSNGNLLFHACLPMNEDESFMEFSYKGKSYKGRELMDFFNDIIISARNLDDDDPAKREAVDFLWYMWTGPLSPMFGKSKIATFENFFIDDDNLRKEIYNPYYKLSKQEEYAKKILEEFSLDPNKGHIINGHVPVKQKDGENPISANGKTYVIDGGLSYAYQKKTGLAGYTLVVKSDRMELSEHKNFKTMEEEKGAYLPKTNVTETFEEKRLVKDSDQGLSIEKSIEELELLIAAYKKGLLKENHKSYKLF
ncbi:MAG: fructose-bisphosphatase class III [Finegoldia sp.]|nr:fructose-bisphosphatase class III [Finegoldia sp.]